MAGCYRPQDACFNVLRRSLNLLAQSWLSGSDYKPTALVT